MEDIYSDIFSEEELRRDWQIITPENIEEIKQKMATEGMDVVKSYMESKLNGWKSQPLHCGITGSSGTGKSSFINTIRNVQPGDEGAAEVDVVETTTHPTSYEDPTNPLLQYWDLPGVGTPRYPKDESYLEKIGFEKYVYTVFTLSMKDCFPIRNAHSELGRYDFFLIVSASRFTENDIWLALQIQKAGKSFFFVRSKIDFDLSNEKRIRRSQYDEKATMQKIRDDCAKNLTADFDSPQVFLISNFDPQMYDFPSLCLELIKALPKLKREALTLSFHAFSNEMVVEKRNILEKRIWIVSTLSAAGALVPLPGVSIVMDTALLINELKFYRQQFGITDETLEELFEKVKAEKQHILAQVKSVTTIGTQENILNLILSFSKSIAAEEASRFLIGIGWLISSGISFVTTYRMLRSQLDRFEKASDEVMSLTLETMMSGEEVD